MFDTVAQTQSLGWFHRIDKWGHKIVHHFRHHHHHHDDDSSPAPAPAAADPDVCAAVHGMFHENICYVPLMQIDDDYSDS
jgi:hypothetical protein